MTRKSSPGRTRGLPSERTLRDWIAAHDGRVDMRSLAREFGVKGAERMALKAMVNRLEADGTLERRAKKTFAKPGTMPPVAVLEVCELDPDGDLFARPAQWDGDGPAPVMALSPGEAEGSAPALGDRVLAHVRPVEGGYEARVIRRLGQSAHRALGVFRRAGGQAQIEPVDRKAKKVFLVAPGDENGAKDGELVLAEAMAGRVYGLPRARVRERLGTMDAPHAISLIAIHAHGIPMDFPDEVLREAESAPPPEIKGRTDLTHLPLITIDPSDARDHDDAVLAFPDDDPRNPGGFVAIVAIADVAWFVRPGSALDRAALLRGNSTYFPDRVAPMLPERLSADLCSLREGEARACMAVRMRFDREGRKRDHVFLRAMMRSAARLTYEQVQAAMDGNPDPRCAALMEGVLKPLFACHRALMQAREARSPLEINAAEFRIRMAEDGKVAGIDRRVQLESMRLIEELMIQANVAAAETLEERRTPLVYRVHDEPSRDKVIALADYLRSIGLSFAKGQVVRPAAFNRVLARAENPQMAELLSDVVLRTQSQAIYATDNLGHFGLNLPRYAHFTSPIRRYADLIVHRALIRALNLGPGGMTDPGIAALPENAEAITRCERRSMAAERDSVDRYVAAYMGERLGEIFQGRIASVTRFGLFVRLDGTGADGLLPIRDLGPEFFKHDETRHALVGQRTGTAYRLGDRIAVRLIEAAPLTGGLRFELAGADAPAPQTRPRRGELRERAEKRPRPVKRKPAKGGPRKR